MTLPDFSNTETAFKARTDSELWRAVSLFRMMNAPLLVRLGNQMLSMGFRLKLPLSPLLRWTIFKQFCGGESLEECRATTQRLNAFRIGCILDYAVEGEKSEPGFVHATQEILRTAREASTAPNVPFVVFKMTALGRVELLERVSLGGEIQLDDDARQEWQRVKERVTSICQTARTYGCPVMIDAEETWVQPIVDQLAEDQMKLHNRDRAWIYTTLQMYRKDRLAYLDTLRQQAHRDGWKLGVKLVRGAYMEKERERAKQWGVPSPIHDSKSATDDAYNSALRLCLADSQTVEICCGTHNENSCTLATKLMTDLGLAASSAQVSFSQLFGMGDHLTYNLAAHGYRTAKYVPYGPVHAALPYLMRRATENTSVAGQSSRELQLLEKELKRRRRHQTTVAT